MLTIGIVTDNCARYLRTALQSIANQNLDYPFEIILVDNASIDQTHRVIEECLKEMQLKATVYLLTAKRNHEDLFRYILQHSHGEFVFHLNGWDYLLARHALQSMCRVLTACTNYSAVCGRTTVVNRNGVPLPGTPFGEVYHTGGDYMLRHFAQWLSPGAPHAVLYRRAAMQKDSAEFDALGQYEIPWDKRFYWHLLQSGRIKVMAEAFYAHRDCDAQVADYMYSHGTKPYLETYRAILQMQKATRSVYQRPLCFDPARQRVWTDLCRAFVATPTPALRRAYREMYRKSPDKGQYRYIYRKLVYRRRHAAAPAYPAAGRAMPACADWQPNAKGGADKSRPMVSVGMTVYNQEEYVGRAIESILAQEVNFRYELVIAEDCSTDRSREIVQAYAARYPHIIKLVLQEHNVGLKEQSRQLRRICCGKYRTHLEGDDYWLTTDRLQKQVDFLEQHPDYIAVTGRIKTVDENGEECPFPYGDINSIYSFDKEYTLRHFERWLLPSHTGALLYRNVFYDLPEDVRTIYESTDVAGDRKTALFLVMQGRVHCLGDYISVRRIVDTPTNFTAVNRSAHPYSMIYDWMGKLEQFAMDLCGVRIDLADAKEQQWLYATHYFFKNPNRVSLYHVRRIYKLSTEKSLYRQLLRHKVHTAIRRANRELGVGGVIAKALRIGSRMVGNVLFRKGTTQPKDTSSILIGHANKQGD